MSMMDTLNAPQGQGSPAASGQPQPGGQGAPAPGVESFARLQGGDLQGELNKLMFLTSKQLWQEGMADLVNEQLLQDDSDPSAIIGKFVSFLLSMCNGAYNSKQQAPEPVVMCGVAEQMADQMTDIALNNQTVSPGDADDTSEAAALIGIQMFLEKFGAQVSQSDQAEYGNILKELIQNSPGAAQLASEAMDDAQNSPDVDAVSQGGAVPTGTPQPTQGGGMSAALGGQ